MLTTKARRIIKGFPSASVSPWFKKVCKMFLARTGFHGFSLIPLDDLREPVAKLIALPVKNGWGILWNCEVR